MPLQILRAVFDCNIFIQALLNPKGIAAQCLDAVGNKRVELYLSKATLDEIRDVILRPNIFARLPDATTEQFEAFIENLTNISSFIKIVPSSFKYERDPKDEMIVDLAVTCKADYIVSRDRDLLDLMTSFDDESKEFRQKFRPLKVVAPVEFLKIIAEKDLPLNSQFDNQQIEVVWNCDRTKIQGTWEFILKDESSGFKAIAGGFSWRKNFNLL